MSDDGLGSYSPGIPSNITSKKTMVRTTKPDSRIGPIAGPSSKPASGAIGSQRRNLEKTPEPSESDDLYGEVYEGGEEEAVAKGRPTKEISVDASSNGRATSKGKGKAKAESQSKAARKVPESVEADDDIEMVDTEVEVLTKLPTRATTTASRAKRSAPPATRTAKGIEKELARVRQKLVDTEAQRDSLSSQLEELLQVRNTAAEESLDHQSLHYEARLKTQEKLIQELTSQLARVEPLARSGKTSLLHFLTRDAADEEQRALENEVDKWKDAAKAKDAIIIEKDKRIAELERTERDVRYELKAEIERSKALASKAPRYQPPGSATRRGGGLVEDPKHTAVVKFYEDLTNLLVPNLKFEAGKYLGKDETVFTCIYTYMDLARIHDEGPDQGIEKSLSFSLRFYSDLAISEEERTPEDENVTSPDQIIPRIKYTPLELDKESLEFVQRLKFLGEGFTFGRAQLPLFLKTMHDTLGGATQEDEDEMEADDD